MRETVQYQISVMPSIHGSFGKKKNTHLVYKYCKWSKLGDQKHLETRLGWLGSEGTRNSFVPFLVLALNRVSINMLSSDSTGHRKIIVSTICFSCPSHYSDHTFQMCLCTEQGR